MWSAVQSFRDKEKAGISDIVVYTEFGPDPVAEPAMRSIVQSSEPNSGKPVKSENEDVCNNLVQQSEMSNCFTEKETDEETQKEKCEDASLSEKCVTDETDSVPVDIEKLSIIDKKAGTKQQENHNNEKLVKIQNQKNKESQHTFLPKFLSSNKEKDVKDKDKEDQEPKVKTKKSLNFFRRKSSTSSPTHTNSSNLNNQKSDLEQQKSCS